MPALPGLCASLGPVDSEGRKSVALDASEHPLANPPSARRLHEIVPVLPRVENVGGVALLDVHHRHIRLAADRSHVAGRCHGFESNLPDEVLDMRGALT